MELTEVRVFVAGDEALGGKHRIIARRRVALGEHKAVAVGIVRIAGIDAHVVEENAGHQLDGRKGAAGMAAAGIGRHRDDVAAHLTADLGKLLRVHGRPPNRMKYL